MGRKLLVFFTQFKERTDIIGTGDIRRFELIKQLSKKFEIEIYTLGSNSTKISRPILKTKENIFNNIVKLNNIITFILLIFYSILLPFLVIHKMWQSKRTSSYLILTQTPLSGSGFSGLIFGISIILGKYLLRIKLWTNMHDIEELNFTRAKNKGFNLSKFKSLIIRATENILVRSSDYLTTPSYYTMKYCIDKYNYKNRKSILRASINVDDMLDCSRDIINKQEIIIGYIGSFYDIDLTLVVKSIGLLRKNYPNVSLHIISQNMPGEFRRLNDYNWIHYLNGKYDEFFFIVSKYSILVDFPIDSYGQIAFGNKVPMYLGSGVPVIVPRTLEFEKYFGKNPDFLIYAEPTVESLSNAITDLIDHPDLAKKISDSARDFVINNLTWDLSVRFVLNELGLT